MQMNGRTDVERQEFLSKGRTVEVNSQRCKCETTCTPRCKGLLVSFNVTSKTPTYDTTPYFEVKFEGNEHGSWIDIEVFLEAQAFNNLCLNEAINLETMKMTKTLNRINNLVDQVLLVKVEMGKHLDEEIIILNEENAKSVHLTFSIQQQRNFIRFNKYEKITEMKIPFDPVSNENVDGKAVINIVWFWGINFVFTSRNADLITALPRYSRHLIITKSEIILFENVTLKLYWLHNQFEEHKSYVDGEPRKCIIESLPSFTLRLLLELQFCRGRNGSLLCFLQNFQFGFYINFS